MREGSLPIATATPTLKVTQDSLLSGMVLGFCVFWMFYVLIRPNSTPRALKRWEKVRKVDLPELFLAQIEPKGENLSVAAKQKWVNL